MEPSNVKALLRKAQAFAGQKMLPEAFDTFNKVLDIDATNQIAQNEVAELRKKLPLQNAFRMKIEEVDDDEPKASAKRIVAKSEKLDLPDAHHVPKLVQNIIMEEPTPFDKLALKERENLVMPHGVPAKKADKPLIQEIRWWINFRESRRDDAVVRISLFFVLVPPTCWHEFKIKINGSTRTLRLWNFLFYVDFVHLRFANWLTSKQLAHIVVHPR